MIPWRLKHRHIWFDINFKISNNLKSGEKNSLMWRRLWNTMLQWHKDTKEIIRTVHLNTLASSHHRRERTLGTTEEAEFLRSLVQRKIFFDETINYFGEILAPSKGFPMTTTLKRQDGRLEILTEVRIELEFWKQNLNVENKTWIIWYFMHNSSILHQNFDLKILVKKCHKKA